MDTIKRVKRRTWPEALKREIVSAAFAPGASVSVVARQYDVNTNLVFTWRKLHGGGAAGPPAPQLVPVVVTADRPIAAPPAPAADTIETELPHGARVQVGRGVKAATLRLVLDALDRR
jgi:transposase